MTEYERVKEEIAKLVWDFDDKLGIDYRALGNAILSLDGIEIRAADQSYPEIPRKDIAHIIMERDTMLREAGFIKVIPKESIKEGKCQS